MDTARKIWKIAVNDLRRMMGNARFYVALLWAGAFMQQSMITIRRFSAEKRVGCGIWILCGLPAAPFALAASSQHRIFGGVGKSCEYAGAIRK